MQLFRNDPTSEQGSVSVKQWFPMEVSKISPLLQVCKAVKITSPARALSKLREARPVFATLGVRSQTTIIES